MSSRHARRGGWGRTITITHQPSHHSSTSHLRIAPNQLLGLPPPPDPSAETLAQKRNLQCEAAASAAILEAPTLQDDGVENSVGQPGVTATSARIKWIKPDCDAVSAFRVRLREFGGGEWLVSDWWLVCWLVCRLVRVTGSVVGEVAHTNTQTHTHTHTHTNTQTHKHTQTVYEGHPGGGFSLDDTLTVSVAAPDGGSNPAAVTATLLDSGEVQPITNHDSLATPYYSLFTAPLATTHYSLLTTHYSLLPYSPPTTNHPLSLT